MVDRALEALEALVESEAGLEALRAAGGQRVLQVRGAAVLFFNADLVSNGSSQGHEDSLTTSQKVPASAPRCWLQVYLNRAGKAPQNDGPEYRAQQLLLDLQRPVAAGLADGRGA